MKGYHDDYRKHIANALEDSTMQLSYQEWLEYALADCERELSAANAKIDAALAIPEADLEQASGYGSGMWDGKNEMREQFRAVLST